MKKKPRDVTAYITAAPKEVQHKLKELRAAIKEAAPDAEEYTSYGMPYYSYKGRLAYFAFAKAHVGVYIPTPILQEHREELKKYSTSTATLRLPLDKKLPLRLIQKLVKARAKRNEERSKN